jgi:hypothetical protein
MGLEVLEMVMAIEEKFSIRVRDETLERLHTVGRMREEFVRRMVEAGARDTPLLRAQVWDGIVQVIYEHAGIAPKDVKPESRWVPDISESG